MVPPLESRILNVTAKANINGSSSTHANMPLTANVIEDLQRRAKKRVHHYSADPADRSDRETLPTRVLPLHKATTVNKVVEQHAKRRMTPEEASFEAFNARKDLTKAGVQCPLDGLIGTSRTDPHGNINKDGVKLVVVSRDKPYDYYESDLEAGVKGDIEVSQNNNVSSHAEDYMQLFSCSQHFYTTERQIPNEHFETIG